MVALFSATYAGVLEDVLEERTSVHDLATNDMIGFINELAKIGKKDLAMELVDRSKNSPKHRETINAIEAATEVFCGDLIELIADFSVGSQIEGLDLNEVIPVTFFERKTLLSMAVSKQKRPNVLFFPLPFLSPICWR